MHYIYVLATKYTIGLRFVLKIDICIPKGLMFMFQLFQIYSGLLSRIHPICKAMGLVNTHGLLIWKVL